MIARFASNVETSGDFDPAQDGLDFYESLEGMLVQMNDLVSTSYTFTSFGEIWVAARPNGAPISSVDFTPSGVARTAVA